MRQTIAIATAGTVFAVLVSPVGPLGGFWAPASHGHDAAGHVRGGLIAEAMVENLAFGAGVAVLFTGLGWFVAKTPDRTRAMTAWLATVWLFASWMPHGNLHRHVGMDPAALLPIEWVFHVGSIAAIAALTWAVAWPVRQGSERLEAFYDHRVG